MIGDRALSITSRIDLVKHVRQEVNLTLSAFQQAKEIKLRVESVGS